MITYNNISYSNLLDIISHIPITKAIKEDDMLIPFKNYINEWKQLPNRELLIHFWSVLTEQGYNSFYPNRSDAFKLIFEQDREFKCNLYMTHNKIEALIIYETTNINPLDRYIYQLPLLSALSSSIHINFKYIHITLIIINNITIYPKILNNLFDYCNNTLLLTKSVSYHPEGYYYDKYVIGFMDDKYLKDDDNLELSFKIIYNK